MVTVQLLQLVWYRIFNDKLLNKKADCKILEWLYTLEKRKVKNQNVNVNCRIMSNVSFHLYDYHRKIKMTICIIFYPEKKVSLSFSQPQPYDVQIEHKTSPK